MIREKKEAKKKLDEVNDQQSRGEFWIAKKKVTKMVAKAKAQACRRIYDDLNTDEGQKNIFIIAKARETVHPKISPI